MYKIKLLEVTTLHLFEVVIVHKEWEVRDL